MTPTSRESSAAWETAQRTHNVIILMARLYWTLAGAKIFVLEFSRGGL